MASKSDIDADLTLEIDGRNVTPEKFQRGTRAFFSLVNEITRSLAGPNQFVHWVVQVKDGSNLIGLVPHHYSVSLPILNQIYEKVQDGIETLEHDAKEPDGFPETALRHIRELGSVAGTDEKDDTKIRVWTKKQPAVVTHKVVAHVAVLLNEAYEDFGTIEGRIQVISEQGALHVFITEPIKQRRVRCYFDEDMLPAFLAAFRKRVEVSGRIKYRRDHTPISIYATQITEFPHSKDLPSYRDMRGILRKKRA